MAEQEQAADKQLAINKIYVKDCSFESPQSPGVFRRGEWQPQTNLNLRSSHAPMEDNHHEVVLTITVEAKDEEKALFLVELQQAGIFEIAGYEGEELAAVLGSFCPNILFPYARETIANLIQKGGFPEFVLQPINFDALYLQAKQQQAEGAAAEAH
ncbi:MAG: protein-export chaperone SecB [Gammaproteobacteria bacterium]|nr:protein-export chaperone SecB [Gammaproteobacteria bacterium]